MDSPPSTAGSSRKPLRDPDREIGNILGYNLKLDPAIEMIRRSGARRVGLQVPEGLKRAAFAISRQITRETGAEVIISGDPCYGACDLDVSLCREVDLLFHLGHAELGESPSNAVFLEVKMIGDLRDVVGKASEKLKSGRVGVATTIQHVHNLEGALQVLREHGIEGLLGPAGGRTKHPGQVLGCCYSSAKALDVDEYLFIGTGQFHPLGIALATGKRVVTADPATGEISEIDPDPMLRRRFGAIARAEGAKTFAVLISKKPGQKRMSLAQHIMDLGEAKGLEMFLVYLDNIEPDRLQNLGAEAAVSTACPRIALDDAAKYKIPVLTPPEFEVLVRERPWEPYRFDEIQ